MTNTLIGAVEMEGFAKICFGETLHLNGSNQRIDHIQRPPGLRVLVALVLSFQNHHHLSLYLSVGPSTHLWREARLVEINTQNCWLKQELQRLYSTCRSQLVGKPMFAMAQTHPQLGWVGQVWVSLGLVPLNCGGKKKNDQNML